MRKIWSILLIKSDLKGCIHLSRSLFLYYLYNYSSCDLVHVTWYGDYQPHSRNTEPDGVPSECAVRLCWRVTQTGSGS